MKFTKSVYGKMLLRIILFLVIPFLLVTLYMIRLLSNELVNSHETVIELSVEQARATRQLHVDNVYDISSRIAANNNLKGFLLVPYNKQNVNYYRTQIAPIIESDAVDTYSYSIRIFTTNTSISRGFGSFYHISDMSGEAFEAFLASDANDTWIYPDFSQGYYSPMVNLSGQYTYLKKVTINDELLYLMSVSVPEAEMDQFSPVTLESSSSLMRQPTIRQLSGGEKMLVSYDPAISDADALLAAYESEGDAGAAIEAAGQRTRSKGDHVLRRIETAPFPQTILLVYPTDSPRAKLFILLAASLVFIVAMFFFVLKHIRQIYRSMYDCLEAFDDSSANGYQEKLSVTGDDEMARLASGFNAQIEKIQQLIKITADQAVLMKESEIKALRQQINPHFLYNTFETFSYRMELHHLYAEADAMVSFSNMLRYNMSGNEPFSTLALELAQVDDFMNIQKLKYKNIEYDVNVPLSLYDLPLPRFILQPIIENCFTHGYYNEAMYIMLNVWHDEAYIFFEVFDSGRGISASDLTLINEALNTGEDKDRVGIGLSNINRRLQLFYSEESKIQIYSQELRWTILNWKIPFNESAREELS